MSNAFAPEDARKTCFEKANTATFYIFNNDAMIAWRPIVLEYVEDSQCWQLLDTLDNNRVSVR